jgi:hypothetical protein
MHEICPDAVKLASSCAMTSAPGWMLPSLMGA